LIHDFAKSLYNLNFAGKSLIIKSAVTIFLILLLNCQIFNNFLVMATFYANENYIAANLCVNKDHPEMHCNGHCQLDKKLHEDQKQNQPNPDKKVSFEVTVFIKTASDPMGNIGSFITITPQYGIPAIFTSQSYQKRLLHPPASC